jgi:broad specificity phosphatase PhoE
LPNLIFVRHSLPEIIPDLPAHQWHLSDEGWARCKLLADKIRSYSPEVVVSSIEPKAKETAQLVAGQLGLSFQTVEGLHEHERNKVKWLGKAQFELEVAKFFKHPEQVVMGEETADQAYERFALVVTSLVEKYANNIAVVAHGTVITLFVARKVGIEPFPFWQQLGLPALVVLSVPEMKLIAVERW